MLSNEKGSSGGIGFFGLLAVLFIGLKLGGILQWSWIWVLSPLWLGFIILLAIIIICGILTVIFN